MTKEQAFQTGYSQGFAGKRLNRNSIPADLLNEFIAGRNAGKAAALKARA